MRGVWARQGPTLRILILMAPTFLMANDSIIVTAQEPSTIFAGIHQGTCDHPGQVVFPLPALTDDPRPEASPVPALEHMGADSAQPILTSQTTLDVLISTLYEQDHALVISRGEDGSIIACGDVGGLMELQMAGMVMPGDRLIVGVGEREDSGFSGIALFTTEGLSTTITTYLLAGAPHT